MAKHHARSDSETQQARSSAREISRENSPDSPVVQHLQRQIANAFLLYANYKRYHWQSYGPLFRDLHLFFDELAAAVQATVDELAERVRMIGQDPIAMPAEVMEATSIKPARADQSMREMVEEANAHVVRVIREMREAIEAADEAGDPGTADVLTRFVQIHEKHEWFLRDLLEKSDGFVS